VFFGQRVRGYNEAQLTSKTPQFAEVIYGAKSTWAWEMTDQAMDG
jgi:hypothetical protein